MKLTKQQEWYTKLLEDLQELAVNRIVELKHAIGKRILEDELKFEKAEYGGKRIEGLGKDLGISKSDLYYCVNFAKKFQEIPTALENSSWRDITQNVLPNKKREPNKPLPLPEGEYNVIYVDPPWKYSDEQDTSLLGGAKKHYSLMTIEELCELKVPSANNAVLFMWVTSPLLEECFDVINSWGFKYKTSFIWDKVKHNMGHYNSVRHELLLICTKGSFVPENKKLFDSVYSEERREHSQKPSWFYEMIETLYPSGKYLELFARNKHSDKWTVWGDQI
jgi:N6-adenosine-specific RNA methylase IME4